MVSRRHLNAPPSPPPHSTLFSEGLELLPPGTIGLYPLSLLDSHSVGLDPSGHLSTFPLSQRLLLETLDELEELLSSLHVFSVSTWSATPFEAELLAVTPAASAKVSSSHPNSEDVVARALPSSAEITPNNSIVGHISPQLAELRMDYRGSSSRQHNVKAGLDDLKKNIHILADFVAVGITNNRKMATDVKQLVSDVRHVSYQTSCHDSRIDDHDMDLIELMGTMERIEEDLQKLAQMNQCSHYQDHPGEIAQPMEELFVT